MKFLKGLLMFLGVLFLGISLYGIFVFHSISPIDSSSTNSEQSITQQSESMNQSEYQFALPQNSVNKAIQHYIDMMPDNSSELRLKWQDDKVIANVNVPFHGNSVPAEITANPVVVDRNLRLDIEGVKVSGFSIPTKKAYQLMVSNVALPHGFSYDQQLQSIHIDVAILLNLPENLNIEADYIDQQNHLLYLLMSQ